MISGDRTNLLTGGDDGGASAPETAEGQCGASGGQLRPVDLQLVPERRDFYGEVLHRRHTFYIAFSALGMVLLGAGVVLGAIGGRSSGSLLALTGAVAAAAVVLILGRLQIRVDARGLEVVHGWLLPMRRFIKRSCIDDARVRLAAGGRRWSHAVQRGVEITVGGGRVFLPSRNPKQLKEALIGRDATDEPPEYRQENLRLPRRRMSRGHQNWALVHPNQVGGHRR